jgi:hypothetical protein
LRKYQNSSPIVGFNCTTGFGRTLRSHDNRLRGEGRPENAGLEHLIHGIALAHPEDEVRIVRASAVLDDLYEYFRRKRRP